MKEIKLEEDEETLVVYAIGRAYASATPSQRETLGKVLKKIFEEETK